MRRSDRSRGDGKQGDAKKHTANGARERAGMTAESFGGGGSPTSPVTVGGRGVGPRVGRTTAEIFL